MVCPRRKLRGNPGAAIAFVEITQARDIFPVLFEGAHGVQAGGRTVGIGRRFGAVAGLHGHNRRLCVARCCMAIAGVNRKSIGRPADERHGLAFVELLDKALWDAVVMVFAGRLHVGVVHVCAKVKCRLPERFHPPIANRPAQVTGRTSVIASASGVGVDFDTVEHVANGTSRAAESGNRARAYRRQRKGRADGLLRNGVRIVGVWKCAHGVIGNAVRGKLSFSRRARPRGIARLLDRWVCVVVALLEVAQNAGRRCTSRIGIRCAAYKRQQKSAGEFLKVIHLFSVEIRLGFIFMYVKVKPQSVADVSAVFQIVSTAGFACSCNNISNVCDPFSVKSLTPKLVV